MSVKKIAEAHILFSHTLCNTLLLITIQPHLNRCYRVLGKRRKIETKPTPLT